MHSSITEIMFPGLKCKGHGRCSIKTRTAYLREYMGSHWVFFYPCCSSFLIFYVVLFLLCICSVSCAQYWPCSWSVNICLPSSSLLCLCTSALDEQQFIKSACWKVNKSRPYKLVPYFLVKLQSIVCRLVPVTNKANILLAWD